MPRKLRELKADLLQEGFAEKPGKGSYMGWVHPLFAGKVTLSGQNGDDAQPYQEKQVRRAIAHVRKAQGRQR